MDSYIIIFYFKDFNRSQ